MSSEKIKCDEQKLYDNNYITQGQLNKLKRGKMSSEKQWVECIKCNKKHNEENMCLGINDIIENYVLEKTITNFEKKYLKGWGIENYFCGACASQSLKIMEEVNYGKL